MRARARARDKIVERMEITSLLHFSLRVVGRRGTKSEAEGEGESEGSRVGTLAMFC